MKPDKSKIRSHPCYDESAHKKYGRVHIPVARKCNISCGFCDRIVTEYYHTSRPGVASKIITPDQSISYVEEAIKNEPMIRVAGIAGPGEPLYNPETIKTMKLIHRKFPTLQLCLCTNGLLLPSKIDELVKSGVKFITVTVNAIDPEIGAQVNEKIIVDGKTIRGKKAAEILLKNQLEGIKKAVENGIEVKVNTVLIPDINMNHVEEIAKILKGLNIRIMNIMPLIPCGRFKKLRKPTCDELISARDRCEKYVPQFRACKQCRADACGIPGKGVLKSGHF